MLSLVVDITDRATIPNYISAAINKTLSEHLHYIFIFILTTRVISEHGVKVRVTLTEHAPVWPSRAHSTSIAFHSCDMCHPTFTVQHMQEGHKSFH